MGLSKTLHPNGVTLNANRAREIALERSQTAAELEQMKKDNKISIDICKVNGIIRDAVDNARLSILTRINCMEYYDEFIEHYTSNGYVVTRYGGEIEISWEPVP